ncbi:CheR family methyltransferase [Aliikangiella coralliicola]|uniref:protein-glutamate O-methyltransferase n=1 Tax=Aliikangiella coralliicola TaxID=2592383 RepID=A0A545UHS1_9GAMM|nr:protein-glutamate O-methyltransferase CheR [Aliikangiella coralliicola]TQV89024.1 protein-glutamate O-methyltransferase CheR [Aliikangiella coralliicola]
MAAFNLPEMESKEFALWQTLLEKRTGMWLPESRKAFLIAALTRFMKDKGVNEYKELYSKLDAGAISVLDWASLVDSLTVHETCFYRDIPSLKVVTSYCRNKALEGFQKDSSKPQHVQIWSVGCSTGEEAYSLAIEMDKLNIGLKEACDKTVYFGVTAVDISYPSLAVAREGIYVGRQLDFVPQTTKNFYFNRLADDYYQIKDQIRQRTCFIQSNVLDLGSKNKQEYDVIYCQNVLIYFRDERKKKVINQLITRLKPGGILVLGHGEITNVSGDELTRVDNKHCLAYLRKDN